MKRTKRGYRFMIVIAAVFLIGAVCAAGVEAQTRRISIGTADTGGVYYILGGGIAKVISANVPNTDRHRRSDAGGRRQRQDAAE